MQKWRIPGLPDRFARIHPVIKVLGGNDWIESADNKLHLTNSLEVAQATGTPLHLSNHEWIRAQQWARLDAWAETTRFGGIPAKDLIASGNTSSPYWDEMVDAADVIARDIRDTTATAILNGELNLTTKGTPFNTDQLRQQAANVLSAERFAPGTEAARAADLADYRAARHAIDQVDPGSSQWVAFDQDKLGKYLQATERHGLKPFNGVEATVDDLATYVEVVDTDGTIRADLDRRLGALNVPANRRGLLPTGGKLTVLALGAMLAFDVKTANAQGTVAERNRLYGAAGVNLALEVAAIALRLGTPAGLLLSVVGTVAYNYFTDAEYRKGFNHAFENGVARVPQVLGRLFGGDPLLPGQSYSVRIPAPDTDFVPYVTGLQPATLNPTPPTAGPSNLTHFIAAMEDAWGAFSLRESQINFAENTPQNQTTPYQVKVIYAGPVPIAFIIDQDGVPDWRFADGTTRSMPRGTVIVVRAGTDIDQFGEASWSPVQFGAPPATEITDANVGTWAQGLLNSMKLANSDPGNPPPPVEVTQRETTIGDTHMRVSLVNGPQDWIIVQITENGYDMPHSRVLDRIEIQQGYTGSGRPPMVLTRRVVDTRNNEVVTNYSKEYKPDGTVEYKVDNEVVTEEVAMRDHGHVFKELEASAPSALTAEGADVDDRLALVDSRARDLLTARVQRNAHILVLSTVDTMFPGNRITSVSARLVAERLGAKYDTDVVSREEFQREHQNVEAQIRFAGQVGGVFGSTIGRMLAGRNEVTAALMGGVLGSLTTSAGQAIATGLFDDSLAQGFKTGLAELPTNLGRAGTGIVSSFATAELVRALGIDPTTWLGGAGNAAAGAVIGQIAGNLSTMNGMAALDNLMSGVNASMALTAVGSFVGSKLASEIVQFDTIGGQLGSSIGSAIGSMGAIALVTGSGAFVTQFAMLGFAAGPVGAAIGAFVGYLAGGLIGSFFGGTPRSGADVAWDAVTGQFTVENVYARKGGSKDAARGFATMVSQTLNGLIATTAGTLLDPEKVQPGNYGMRKNTFVYRNGDSDLPFGLGESTKTFKGEDGAQQLISYGITQALAGDKFRLAGGDVFVKRALYNSPARTSGPEGIVDLETLVADLTIAKDWSFYRNNQGAVEAMAETMEGAERDTYLAGWILTTARAADLGLDRRHEADWYGGFDFLLRQAQVTAGDTEFFLDTSTSGKYFRVMKVGPYQLTDSIDIAGQTQIEYGDGDDFVDLRSASIPDQRGLFVDGRVNDDIAVTGDDFTGLTDLALDISQGVRRGAVAIAVAANAAGEKHETFKVGLTGAEGVALTGPDAVVTIVGADELPYLKIGRSFANEADGHAIFRVSLSRAAATAVTMTLSLDGVTATAPDFSTTMEVSSQPHAGWTTASELTIAAGATEFFVRVPLSVDFHTEGNEQFVLGARVTAGNASLANGDVLVSGTGTIVEVSSADPMVWADDAVVHAGSPATVGLGFSKPTTVTSRVDVSTFDRRALEVDIAASIDGGGGNDVIHASDLGDNLIGGDGNDTLYGGKLDDWLLGAGGDDVLHAGAQADGSKGGNGNYLDGGDGDDTLHGREGSDWLEGRADTDFLFGGDGNDFLGGGGGEGDILVGGAGDDAYIVRRGDDADIVDEESAASAQEELPEPDPTLPGDAIQQRMLRLAENPDLRNWAGEEETGDGLTGGSLAGGEDSVSFGPDIDIGDIKLLRNGNDLLIHVMDTNEETDQESESGTAVLLKDWFTNPFKRIEWLKFVDGNEVRIADFKSFIAGTPTDDIINGTDGADFIYGGGGNDEIHGGPGDDITNGGTGNDIVWGDGDEDLVIGGTGDDKLLGGTQADVMSGDAGNDDLSGDAGADLLSGGRGNDTIRSGSGSDTIKYSRGDGQDTIVTLQVDYDPTDTGWQLVWTQDGGWQNGWDSEQIYEYYSDRPLHHDETGTKLYIYLGSGDPDGTPDRDTLEFAPGISVQDITFFRNGNDLTFGIATEAADLASVAEATDRITIQDWYRDDGTWNSDYPIGKFVFYQTGILRAQVDNWTLIAGGSGNDGTLTAAFGGTDGKDWMTGGSGDDVLAGGAENDIISGNGGGDTLRGEGGEDVLYGGGGDDVLDGGAGRDVLVGSHGTDAASYESAAAGVLVHLSDQSTNQGEAAGDRFYGIENVIGSGAADRLGGDDSDNELSGGAGNDVLMGSGGDDVYIWNPGDGADEIVEGALEFDLVVDEAGVLVSGYTMQLTSTENINACDLVVYDSNHNILYEGRVPVTRERIYTNGTKTEFTWGPPESNPKLWPAAGWKTGTMRASGFSVVRERIDLAGEGGSDVIELGANLSLSDLDFQRSGDNLIIRVGNDPASRITVKDHFKLTAATDPLPIHDPRWYAGGHVETLQLRDGFSVSLRTIVSTVGGAADAVAGTANHLLAGDARNNVLTGNSGHDVISGAGGTDILRGESGDDILEGGAGADQLIGGSNTAPGSDPLEPTEGLEHVFVGGNEAAPASGLWGDTVRYASSAAGVTVDLRNAGPQSGGDAAGDTLSGIENVVGSRFADVLDGEAGANRLVGLDGANTLRGWGGDDVLVGGADDDLIEGGDGADDMTGGGGRDLVRAGIGDDRLDGGAGDDQLFGEAGSDTLTGGDGVDRLEGGSEDDGLYAGAGDDTLIGGAGKDILEGAGGNDVLEGGIGDDRYLFMTGPGADRITDTDGINSVEFGEGIAFDQLWFSQLGNDLKIGVIGTEDLVTVAGFFAATGGSKVSVVKTAGHSYYIGHPDAKALVGLMSQASLTVPAEMPASIRDKLAAYWHSGGRAAPLATAAERPFTVNEDSVLSATGIAATMGYLGIVDHDQNVTAFMVKPGSAPTHGTLVWDSAAQQLRYTPAANFHGQDLFSVVAVDADGQSAEVAVRVTVAPVNDAPDDLRVEGAALAVAEAAATGGSAAGTVVGRLTATDVEGNTISWSLADAAGGRFTIDPDGTLKVGNAALLDHEAADGHSIRARATDQFGAWREQVFTVSVLDVNEANSFSQSYAFAVSENVALGTAVGTVLAGDLDLASRTTGKQRYFFWNGTTASATSSDGLYRINELTGAVTTAAALNYEALTAPRSYTVIARDNDGGTGFNQVSTAVQIAVQDVNEANSFAAPYTLSINENVAPNSVVATIKANDPDGSATLNGQQAYYFSNGGVLSATSSDGRYTIEAATGIIRTAATLDHEAMTAPVAYDVVARDRQGGAGYKQATTKATITVADVNEAPASLNWTAAVASIDERDRIAAPASRPAVTLGSFAVVDPDGSGLLHGSYTYSVSDTRFEMVGAELRLKAGISLDFETATSIPLTVTATDRSAAPFSIQKSLTFNVNNVDDVLEGDLNANTLVGQQNRDRIYGLGGNDTLRGEAGDDLLDGGTGDDVLIGGAGSDQLLGGDGNDSAQLSAVGEDLVDGGLGTDTATFAALATAVAADLDNPLHKLTNVENLIGGGGGDTLSGSAAANRLEGGAGDDALHGRDGDDVLVGAAGNDALEGDSGADSLDGGIGDDTLTGGAGIDTLLGGDGADRFNLTAVGEDNVDGGAGIDEARFYTLATPVSVDLDNAAHKLANIENILGGYGNDTLSGSAAANRIDADRGDDLVHGRAGNDTLYGGSGNDSLHGDDGVDVIDGGIGDDALTGGLGVDQLLGGDGADTFHLTADGDTADGGAGIDTASFAAMATALNVDLVAAPAGLVNVENVIGGSAGDTLAGSALANQIEGRAGDDLLRGAAGNDVLVGGDGNDALHGDADADTLDGGLGDDSLTGGTGIDTLAGGAGSDTFHLSVDGEDSVDGGDGVDTASFAGSLAALNVDLANPAVDRISNVENLVGGLGNDTLAGSTVANRLEGGAGNDILSGRDGDDVLEGGDGDDTLAGGAGIDRLTGGDGDDSFQLTAVGEDIVDGGAGSDTASFASVSTAVSADLDNALQQLASVENLVGGGGADTLSGSAVANRLDGGAGNDTLSGRAGDDVLLGGIGNDTLQGDDGIDTLDGGIGDDNLTGGLGADQVSGGDGNDIIHMVVVGEDSADGGAGTDTARFSAATAAIAADLANAAHKLANVENLVGGSGADTLSGSAGVNNLQGADGNDLLSGRAGDDTLLGGLGDDTLLGESDNDTLDGGGGNDTLTGGVGVDRLLGGDGDDLIHLTNDGDTVDGGTGFDTASFAAVATALGIDLMTAPNGLTNVENLIGGSAGDTLAGSGAANRLEGGLGNDSLSGDLGNDALLGGDGNDTLLGEDGADSLDGGAGDDVLTGGAGIDQILAGAGNDLIHLAADAEDNVDAGDGVDTASFAAATAGLAVDLANTLDKLANVENLIGGSGNDTLSGTTAANRIEGGAGNDSLSGRDGNDILIGGAGDDLLQGGTGIDTLVGHVADAAVPDTGNDTVSYAASTAAAVATSGSGGTTMNGDVTLATAETISFNGVRVNLAANTATGADAEGDKLQGIENLIGSIHNDELRAGTASGFLRGGAGNDMIYGGAGNDKLHGEAGNDIIYGQDGMDELDGGDGDDRLFGEGHADILLGGKGADILHAGDAGDELDGGIGNDMLIGGQGGDAYRFNRGTGTDTLYNYDDDSGSDSILFQYDGAGAATNIANTDLWFVKSGKDLVVKLLGTTDQMIVKDWFLNSVAGDWAADDNFVIDIMIAGQRTNDHQVNMPTLLSLMNGVAPPARYDDLPDDLQTKIDEAWGGNEPPTVTAILGNPVSALEGTTVQLKFEVTDPELGSEFLTLTATTSGGACLPIAASDIAKDPANPKLRIVTLRGLPDNHGEETITLTASDGVFTSAPLQVKVKMLAVADSVQISGAVAKSVAAGATVMLAGDLAGGALAAIADTNSEVFSYVRIEGVPVGAVLSDGVNSFTATAGATTATVTSWNLSALRVTPPPGSSADFSMTLKAASRENVPVADIAAGRGTGPEASTVISVTVNGAPNAIRLRGLGTAELPTIGELTATNDPSSKAVGVAVASDPDSLERNLVSTDFTKLPLRNRGEERIVTGAGPDGTQVQLLETGQVLAEGGGAGGGIYGASAGPLGTTSRAYKYTVYVKAENMLGHTLYVGTGGAVENASNGVANANPYFWYASSNSLVQDRWYRVEGYVLPEGHPPVDNSLFGGVFDTVTGAKIANTTTFRFAPGATTTSIRFFSHSGTTEGYSAQWYQPQVEKLEYSYSLVNNAGGRFVINPITGQISASGTAFDHEAADGHSIVVRATDSTGLFKDQAFTVGVTDLNEPNSIQAQYDLAVNENVVVGAAVGSVAAADVDSSAEAFGQQRYYFLYNGVASGVSFDNRFAINATTGAITTRVALNHETMQDPIGYTVVARDNAGAAGYHEVSTAVSIRVNDLNEANSLGANRSLSVDETAPVGTVVGTLSAIDPDDPSQPFGQQRYYFLNGSTVSATSADGRYSIDAISGEIRTAVALNHETMATATAYTAIARDNAGAAGFNQANVTVTIGVNNVNEANSFAAPYSMTVNENVAVGTTVGTIAAADGDLAAHVYGQQRYYFLSAGAISATSSDGRYAIDAATGAIKTNAALDHETMATPTAYTVVARDNAGGTGYNQATTTVTLGVVNLNEPNSIAATHAFSVAENVAVGTQVGAVAASDPDGTGHAFDQQRYYFLNSGSISSTSADGRYSISVTTGAITVAKALDHETMPPVAYTVVARDNAGATPFNQASSVVTISVGDLNEPNGLPATLGLTVNENVAVGFVVGTVAASDPDEDLEPFGQQVYYFLNNGAISATSSDGRYSIDASTGQIKTLVALNHESMSAPTSYTVIARDNGGTGTFHQSATTVTIGVTDLNEPTDLPATYGFTVAENLAAGAAVGSIAASDPDAPGSAFASQRYYFLHNGAISGTSSDGRFSINATTGAITTLAPLNHEATPSFSYTVASRDNGGAAGYTQDTATVTIAVGNVNEAPGTPTGPAAVYFDETGLGSKPANAGAVVASFGLSDPDGTTPSLRFTYLPSAWYNISGNQVRFNSGLNFDFEWARSAGYQIGDWNGDGRLEAAMGTFGVQSFDGQYGSGETLVTLYIQDVNEAPPPPPLLSEVHHSETLPGDPAHGGQVIATFGLSDPDGTVPALTIVGGNQQGWFSISGGNLVFSGGVNFTADWLRGTRGLYGQDAGAYYNRDGDALMETRVATLTLAAVDAHGVQSGTVTYNVLIEDKNETPSLTLQSQTLHSETLPGEAMHAGQVIASFGRSDPDGPVPELRIIGGNQNSWFAISGGNLVFGGGINFSAEWLRGSLGTYGQDNGFHYNSDGDGLMEIRVATLTLATVDAHGVQSSPFTYNVLIENRVDPYDSPTQWGFWFPPGTVVENSAQGTIVADVGATDADGFAIAYSLDAATNPNGAFGIDQATGAIFVQNGVDYEAAGWLQDGYGKYADLKVIATDGGTPISTIVTIRIGNQLLQVTNPDGTLTSRYRKELTTFSESDGTRTGTVWYDRVRYVDNQTGKVVLFDEKPRTQVRAFPHPDYANLATGFRWTGNGSEIVNDDEHDGWSLSPVIFDLADLGLAAAFGSTVSFDVDGAGDAEQVQWVDARFGLLALDRNGDGAVSNGTEIAFTADRPGARTDLEGLAAYDSNGDNILSAADARFGDFRVWQDSNGNARSDPGELKTLAERGIVSLDLAPVPTGNTLSNMWGNVIVNTARFSRQDGTTGIVGDAIFRPAAMDGVTTELRSASAADKAVGFAAGAIVFDYDGDNSSSTTLAGSLVRFDMTGDGVGDATGWIAQGDALLARDRNGNGKIDGIGEITFPDGLDTDGDGALTASDQDFAGYKLWFDTNRNGTTDAGELLSLTEARVSEVRIGAIGAVPAGADDGINPMLATGSFKTSDGVVGTAGAVALAYESQPKPPAEPTGGSGGVDEGQGQAPGDGGGGETGADSPQASPILFDRDYFSRKQGKYRLTSSGGNLTMSLRSAGASNAAATLLAPASIAAFRGRNVGYLSALIVDLDGDGLEVQRYQQSKARFDMDLNGAGDDTGWTRGGDGFLVIDSDGDGLVASGEELSFLAWKPDAANSFSALAQLDSTKDGILDSRDSRFAELRIWADRNGNGRTDGGELRGLADYSIESIGLTARSSGSAGDVGDNLVLSTAEFLRADGGRGAIGDVALAFRPASDGAMDRLGDEARRQIEALREAAAAVRRSQLDLDAFSAERSNAAPTTDPGAGDPMDRRIAQIVQSIASFGGRPHGEMTYDRDGPGRTHFDFFAG